MSFPRKVKFQLKMMFQTSSLEFNFVEENQIIFGQCEAQIKLPVFKQTALFSTKYSLSENRWLEHKPLHSSPEAAITIENDSPEKAEWIDPISLFLAIDEGLWTADSAKVILGENKVINLSIKKQGSEYLIERPSKNQTLYVGKDSSGITYFKLKVPVLGEIKFERKS